MSNNSKVFDQVPPLVTRTLVLITATPLAIIFLISKTTLPSPSVVLTRSAPVISDTSINVNPSDK